MRIIEPGGADETLVHLAEVGDSDRETCCSLQSGHETGAEGDHITVGKVVEEIKNSQSEETLNKKMGDDDEGRSDLLIASISTSAPSLSSISTDL
jgi:hypothetical protein